jgi:hypothetical protein
MEDYTNKLYNEFKLGLDENINEYDVENSTDLNEFIGFLKTMKENNANTKRYTIKKKGI